MLQYKTDFHKKNFLKSGSVFAFKNQVWLMWGNSESLQYRPAYPAICPCDFFLKEPFVWNQYQNLFKATPEEVVSLLSDSTNQPLKAQWSAPEKDNFSKQYNWIQECFSENEIEKAVPYIFENGSVDVDAENLLLEILIHSLKNLNGFLYGHWKDGVGRLGMTPEILVEQKTKTQFSTMAVAGTTTLENFNKNPESFLSNRKENKEHKWVVDDILKVLKSKGAIEIEGQDVVKTPSLVHLRTIINLETHQEVKIEDIVADLHPTAALGTFPRDKNDKIMSYLDGINQRNSFGAPFGFSISEDVAIFVVAIRNIEWVGNQLKIGAGCGVVPESQMESEWVELKHKRESVKQIFGLL